MLVKTCPPPPGPEIKVKHQATYQQWTPTQCPVLGQMTGPSFVNISIHRWQPKDWSNSDNYANSTKRFWPILFSHNVEHVRYRFASFTTEENSDKFTIYHKTGAAEYSGSLPSNTIVGPFQVKTTMGHAGASYLEQAWETNSATSYPGYSVDTLWLNCLATPPAYPDDVYVMKNWAYDGYLQASNDVIWVWTWQPANREMSIVLWPVPDRVSTEANFDVLVSELGQPPWAVWQWQGSRTGRTTPEVVIVPSTTAARKIWIAIGAMSGYGQFRFYANVHAPGYPTQLYARTTFEPTAQQKGVIRKQMRKMAQSHYFATDGRHLIRKFEIWWDGPTSIPKPYIQWVGAPTPNVCFSGDHVTLTSLNWCANGCDPDYNPTCNCADTEDVNVALASGTALHEDGHCYYGLTGEEYACSWWCGHSAMNCLDNKALNQVDYCSLINGGKDPPPGCVGHPASSNNWATMETSFPSNPSYHQGYTPDPFFDTVGSSDPDDPFFDLLEIIEH